LEPLAAKNRSSRRRPLPLLRAPLHHRPTPVSTRSSHHHQELCADLPQLPVPRTGAIGLRPVPPPPNPLCLSLHERLHVHHRLQPRTAPATASTSSTLMRSPSPTTPAPPATTGPRPIAGFSTPSRTTVDSPGGAPANPSPTSNGSLATSSCPSCRSPPTIAAA
jgi:hypothetical protein